MSRKFLINTVTHWDEPPRARHQVASALAEKHQVVFVARNNFGKIGVRYTRINSRLTLVNPSFPVDYRLRIRIPIINEIYQKWLFKELKKKYSNHITLNFDFTAHLIFNFFSPVVYYCNDECIGNTKYPNWFTDSYYRICEKKIIKKSLLCIATSPYLLKKLSKTNQNTIEIPLGANSIISNARFTPRKDSHKIVLCLMGNITQRQVPIELINNILSNESYNLVLIGPIEDSFKRKLVSMKNVCIKGVLKGSDLINSLSEIDIGLALYNKQKINYGTSPNKLWQYLAVGKPVIVSELENLANMNFPLNSVYIYHESNSLTDLIQNAYDEDSELGMQKRIKFAANNTWSKRMELFIKALDKSL